MTTAIAIQQDWPWPDSLDALVAAPESHHLLLENEHVRVLEVRITPGQHVPVHTHRWPGVLHILSSTDFVRCDADGNVLFDTRQAHNPPVPGSITWAEPFPPHSMENVGQQELLVIAVESQHR